VSALPVLPAAQIAQSAVEEGIGGCHQVAEVEGVAVAAGVLCGICMKEGFQLKAL